MSGNKCFNPCSNQIENVRTKLGLVQISLRCLIRKEKGEKKEKLLILDNFSIFTLFS